MHKIHCNSGHQSISDQVTNQVTDQVTEMTLLIVSHNDLAIGFKEVKGSMLRVARALLLNLAMCKVLALYCQKLKMVCHSPIASMAFWLFFVYCNRGYILQSTVLFI